MLGTTLLFTTFAFLNSLELPARIEYIFGFNPGNSSIATPHL